MTTTRPPRGRVVPYVYSHIKQDIVTDRLRAGSPLAEEHLADRYGVSRTPVREALRQLEQDGLVERGSRGFEVRRYTVEELDELYEARTLLEGFAARMAAERHRPVDAVRMRDAHLRMTGLTEDASPDERIASNRAFHTALWRAARNRTVLEVLARLHLHVVRHTTLADPARWARALVEHQDVLDAVVSRDPDRAEHVMVTHLETGREVALRLHEPDDDTL